MILTKFLIFRIENFIFNLEEERKAPFANMNPVLFVLVSLAVVFITYQIIGGLISVFFSGIEPGSSIKDIKTFRIVITFSQFMFILVPVIVLNILRGDDAGKIFKLNTPDTKIFSLSILGIFVIQPFLQLYVVIQNKLIFSLPFGGEFINKLKDFFDMMETALLGIVKSYTPFEFVIVVIVIAVTPAICEELLFRGLILSNLQKLVNASSAVIITGLLFAMFHFDPFNLIPLIILGIYLSAAAYLSGSIYTAMAVHFLNNFFSAGAVYFLGDDFANISTEVPADEFSQLVIWGSVSLVLFIVIIFLMRNVYRGNQKMIF
jgi:uncharacterized protein